MNQWIPAGPCLIIRHTGQVFSLASSPMTIGQHRDNTIVLADLQAAPHHAVVSWEAGGYVIQDLESVNGTFVNEVPINRVQALHHGDMIRVGDTVLEAHLAASRRADQATRSMPSASLSDSAASSRSGRLRLFLVAAVALVAALCLLAATILLWVRIRGAEPTPTVSPTPGALPAPNEQVLVSTATATATATRTEPTITATLPATAEPTLQATAQPTVPETDTPLPTVTPSPTPSPSVTPTRTASPTTAPIPTETTIPPPDIAYLRAVPASISAGGCTTLEWGFVSGAYEAHIDHGIGGVGTPGSLRVCPATTTTYVLVGKGPGGVTTASATVTVGPPLSDLAVEGIAFDRVPLLMGMDHQVQIAIRNAGAAAAGPFNWQWQPGAAPPLGGQITAGLPAGGTTVVTLFWQPDAVSANLPTVARVDTGDVIVESDESNNDFQAVVQVVEPTVRTVTLTSQSNLDGYVIGGQGTYAGAEIRVGNIGSELGERVYRGFLSFDLGGIPDDAIITEAEFRIFQPEVVGDPHGILGQLVLEHVDYGASLDISDFDTSVMGSLPVSGPILPGTWYTSGEIVPWIEQDLAASRGRTQIRLQFSGEADGGAAADYARFESGNNTLGTGNLPELTLTYVY